MAQLVEAAEARFVTDFAIVDAIQDDGLGDTPGTFASGTSGGVVMAAGTRHADAFVRVERWDAEPPEPPEHDGWEDRDTVVFHEIPGSGPALIHGFDPVDGEPGVSIDGLGRGLARVQARGRHDDPLDTGRPRRAGVPSEEWLVQLYPDPQPGGTDPLLLPPRRVARQPFAWPTPTAWQQALQGWWSHGWRWTFQGTPGFLELETVLRIAGAPASYETLRGLWDQVGALDDRLADLSPTPGALAMRTAAAARTAELAGMAAIETWADLVEALERLGMVIAWRHGGETLLVVNPGLGPVGDAVALTDDERASVRHTSMTAHGAEARDIASLIRWDAGGERRTSIAQLAARLDWPHHKVLEGLRAWAYGGPVTLPDDLDDLAAHEDLVLRLVPRE